jgi:uncharacterized membrane protein YccC
MPEPKVINEDRAIGFFVGVIAGVFVLLGLQALYGGGGLLNLGWFVLAVLCFCSLGERKR